MLRLGAPRGAFPEGLTLATKRQQKRSARADANEAIWRPVLHRYQDQVTDYLRRYGVERGVARLQQLTGYTRPTILRFSEEGREPRFRTIATFNAYTSRGPMRLSPTNAVLEDIRQRKQEVDKAFKQMDKDLPREIAKWAKGKKKSKKK